MAKMKSFGNIAIRFPPDFSTDRESDLRWKIRKLLDRAGGCAFIMTSALGGPPGWALVIDIKKAADVLLWRDQLTSFLCEQQVSRDATIESSVWRGPVVVTPSDPDSSLASLLRIHAKEALPADANLFLEFVGEARKFSGLLTAIWEQASITGTVETDWLDLKNPNLKITIDRIPLLQPCVKAICDTIMAHPTTVSVTIEVFTGTKPEVQLVYAGRP